MNRLLYTLLCIGLAVVMPFITKAQLTANFSANITSSCSPVLVNFTDLSTGNPTGWQWNLGNGVTSTQQNPSTTYFTVGTYTITLTVSNGASNNTKTIVNYITIIPTPVVNFTASDTTTQCAPKTVTFTNQSVPGTAGTAIYSWDFGDGGTSSAASPTHTYTTPGTYSVTLVVTNSSGCNSSTIKTSYIHILPKPHADFTSANASSCTAPATVNFSNASTGSTSYQWNFGDGGTATTANPSHTYNASGSYTVTLITSNGSCSDTMIKTAFVNINTVTPAFTINNNNACAGQTVSFTNSTTPAGSTYSWSFGDGGTSTAANPSHTYAAGGTYTVKLVAGLSGCGDSVSHTVTVLPKPTAQFTAPTTFGCTAPFTAQFNNSSSGATSYAWDFGDGGTSTATSPSHTYASNGNYTVRLIASNGNGCSDTLTMPGYINVSPPFGNIFATPASGCAGFTTTFGTNISQNIQPGTWDFGDGTPIVTGSYGPTHTYSNVGTYTVTATIPTIQGCVFTGQMTITVNTKPTASFTAIPTTICPHSSVSFTNTSTGTITGYTWNFGNGIISTQTSPTIIYPSTGTYTVTLVATNGGCSDTFTQTNLVVVHPPKSAFTFTANCSNRKQITFNNASTGATSCLWDFGDATATTATTSPVHTYAANGDYNVTLITYNSTYGCTDTIVKVVHVFDIIPQFSTPDTSICKGSAANFTALSGLYYTNYTWDYGDGVVQTTTGNTASHAYTTSGVYTVKLVIKDIYNCKDSVTRTNYVTVTGPIVAFSNTPTIACAPALITFTNSTTSSVSGVSITGYLWRFGDGTTSAATAPTHTYTAAGTYAVTLIATDARGCKDSLTNPSAVIVNKPTAAFASADTNICLGQATAFTNSSTTGGSITYDWSFGDGGTSTATAPSHTYTATGNYTVRLIVTAAGGCKDTLIRTNYVHVSGITASFTMSDSVANCPPLTVNFTNTTSGATGYTWTFGNGSTSTQLNPTTVYTTPGVYTVKLKATSTVGCKDSTTKTVTIGGPTGTFSFAPPSGCAPVTVNFTATTTNTQYIIWDMDNGITQTTPGNTLSYTYTTPGTFIPKIILSNGVGCNIPVYGIDTVKVDAMDAEFSFSPNNICNTGVIQFTDTVYTSISAVNTRSWTFGDGGTSTVHNPTHTYAGPGTYTVKLIIGNANGCKDTVIHTVNILTPPTVSAGSNVAICNGSSTTLNATGAASYVWTPATGLSSTTIANPVANPTGTTTYTVTGTAANGCSNTATVTVTVNPLPIISAGSTQNICAGASVTLNATGGTSYSWSPATGLSATNIANPVASPTTTTTYTVVGTNGTGCSNTATVTVNVTAQPTVSAGSNQTICTGSSVTLNATGATTYVWTPATGLSSTTIANPVASPATTTTYTVTGTATGGCSNTATVTVTVTNLPAVSAGSNVAICTGSSTTLNATGATTYVWTPSTGLSSTTIANPVASPTATTTYTVTGTATGGCSNTANVTVTVNQLPTISAGNNTSMCAGSSVTLNATGGNTYLWSPATGLSSTTIANPVASPAATTTYTVTGTNTTTGCSNTATVTDTVKPLPTIAAGSNVTICTGSSTTLSATGGVSYVWTPATGLSSTTIANPVASPAATTTYTVTGTGANGCTNTSTVTVNVTNLPTVSAGSNVAICTGSSTTLNATGATSYVWTPATGLSSTTIANPVANPTATTTYTVTGTISGGCSNTATVTVTVNQLPTISAGNNTSMCAGSSVTLNATGGNTYVWSPATGLSSTTIANPVASPAATTTYTVTGTNTTTGCSNTATVTDTVKPLPTIAAGSNVTICTGSSTTLSATGGVSYVWTPATGLSGTTIANPVASPAATTTYTVTGTGANGCTNTSTVTVNVTNLPTVSAGSNVAICTGSSTTLNATGATSYVWTPSTGLSSTTIANPVASPTATTTYTVTGTISGGCSNTATVTVTVNQLPTISAGNNTSMCAGSSVTLNATGGNTYVWSPATGLSSTTIANPVASPAATTTYTVTGTNTTTGCSNTATVTDTVKPQPTIGAGSNVSICAGGSTTLTATGGVSYTWSPATGLSCTSCTSPVATPAAATTYTVTGTGANGCTNTATVSVGFYPQPVISAGANQTLCAGSTLQLNATGGVSYVWTPSTGLSSTTIANPVANPANTTTYTIKGTSANGCVDSGHITITVSPLPTVSAGNGQTICSGSSAQLQASGAATYTWSPATGLSATNIANPTASPLVTTTYTVTGTNAAGCSSTATVIVTVKPLPTVSGGGNQTICGGSAAQLLATGAATYVWSPATGLSCTNCPNPVATPSVPTTYTVTGTDASGCSNTATVNVSFFPQPVINAGADQTICRGAAANLLATGGSTYLWTPATALSATNIPNPTATPLNDITYKVIGTDTHGCRDSDLVAITVIQPVPTTVGPNDTLCAGESTKLSATGGISYTWTPATSLDNSTVANPTATPATTTTYTVYIKENQCFTDTANVTVVVNPQPTVNAGPDQVMFAGSSVQLFPVVTDATIFQWSPGTDLSCDNCQNPMASPTHTTTYTITVSNIYGCTASDTLMLTVKCDNSLIFMPNTFTPNGDGQNDRFYPHGKGITTVQRLRIYDRWGEVIYDMQNVPVNDPAYGWDGTFKGETLKPDTYIYILEATCVTGEPIQVKGDISLIR